MKLVELRLKEGNGLSVTWSIFNDRKDPKVPLSLRSTLRVDDEPAIPGPLIGHFWVVGREKQFILDGPADRLMVEILVFITSIGSEHNAVAPRRPKGLKVP